MTRTNAVMSLAEPYATRSVRCLDLLIIDGWRLKLYGIAYRGEHPAQVLVDAAVAVAQERLRNPRLGGGRTSFATIAGRGFRPARLPLGRWRPMAGAAVLAYVVVATDRVDWAAAGLVAGGSLVGGFLGSTFGRRLPAPVLRTAIVLLGLIAIAVLVSR